MESNIIVGSVVWSKAGRDKDRYYVVIEVVNDDYVLVVDGKYHKLDKPKIKNKKHLKYHGDNLTALAEKLLTNKQIFDAEINKALRVFENTKNSKE